MTVTLEATFGRGKAKRHYYASDDKIDVTLDEIRKAER